MALRNLALVGGLGAVGVFATKAFLDSKHKQRSPEPERPTDPATPPAVALLWDLYEELWDLEMRRDPLSATMVGDFRFNHQLADLSESAFKADLTRLRRLAARATRLPVEDIPEETDRQNLVFLMEKLRMDILARETFQAYELPLNHLFGPHVLLPQAASFHPWRSEGDAASFLARLRAFKGQAEQIVDALRCGMARGRTLPREAAGAVAAQCRAMVVEAVEESPLYPASVTRIEAVGGSVAELEHVLMRFVTPAYRMLWEFMEDEYIASARVVPGICAFVGGQEMYKGAVEYFTSLRMDPRDVHELGLKEVDRIQGLINAVRNDLGDSSETIIGFVDKMKNNPELFPKDRDHIVARYEELIDEITAKLPTLFSTMPPTGLEVRQIEQFREKTAPPAHYYPAPDDNSRPAVFYANTSNPKERPLYTLEAVTLHEGVPGHHLQISVAKKLTGLPRIRKQTQGFCLSYTEGWGLYAEYLGEVMGCYEDPRAYFGRLITEIWRAARLVVDTGIHAFGWSRKQAIEYLHTTTALPIADVQAEVERYMVIPGQALAYKMGEIKLVELKERAVVELGDRFGWKGFHDAVLRDGAVPLLVLQDNIARWIEDEKQAP